MGFNLIASLTLNHQEKLLLPAASPVFTENIWRLKNPNQIDLEITLCIDANQNFD